MVEKMAPENVTFTNKVKIQINSSQLAKMKKYIPDMSIYRDEVVGLKSCKYTL